MTALSINGLVHVVRLTVPLHDFPALLASHGSAYDGTEHCERLGAAYVRKRFPAADTAAFVQAVCKWGNYAGVGGKVLKHNKPSTVRDALKDGHAWLHKGNPRQAIERVTSLHGLGVSFGSKHLKFLAPDHAVVLDSIIGETLGYKRTPEGYEEFVRDCATIRDLLNAASIPTGRVQSNWRISDVEMAIFKSVNP